MEDTMCHYRGSYVSEDRAKAEADRQRELQVKRTEAVDKLRHDADGAAQKAASTPAKEPVPAK
jgi:glycerol-3-phosphate cytidylyltransferase-like family protein